MHETETVMTQDSSNPETPDASAPQAETAGAHPEAPPLVLVPRPVAEDKAAAKAAATQKKRDESAEESPFSVSVGLVYDGPLDLLLDLIRKQDTDISASLLPRSPRS